MAYGSEIRFYKMPAVNIYRMNFSIWAKRIKGRTLRGTKDEELRGLMN